MYFFFFLNVYFRSPAFLLKVNLTCLWAYNICILGAEYMCILPQNTGKTSVTIAYQSMGTTDRDRLNIHVFIYSGKKHPVLSV